MALLIQKALEKWNSPWIHRLGCKNRVRSGHSLRFSEHSFIHACTCKCMCARTNTHTRTRTHTHTHTHYSVCTDLAIRVHRLCASSLYLELRCILECKVLHWNLSVAFDNYHIQPLGQRSTYNTIIADPGSPYAATFQFVILFLFTARFSTGCNSVMLHFYDSKQRPEGRATLLLSARSCL